MSRVPGGHTQLFPTGTLPPLHCGGAGVAGIVTHTPRFSVVPAGQTHRLSTGTLPPVHRNGVTGIGAHNPRFSIVPRGHSQRLSISTLPPVQIGNTGVTIGRSGVTGTQVRRRTSGV
jgi:hypothetical protein